MTEEALTVSVVMCTYNGSAFIDEQIGSIVQQQAPLLELIICDDFSTDDTWQKLRAWKEKYSFIRLHQNGQNLGYNRNFEQAIRLATGDVIALSDQDDIWLPQKSAACYRFLKTLPYYWHIAAPYASKTGDYNIKKQNCTIILVARMCGVFSISILLPATMPLFGVVWYRIFCPYRRI